MSQTESFCVLGEKKRDQSRVYDSECQRQPSNRFLKLSELNMD